jgi:hypothetical protein
VIPAAFGLGSLVLASELELGANIDFVLFEDGSSYGQDKTQIVKEMRDTLDANMSTESYLLELLQTKSVDDVRVELQERLAGYEALKDMLYARVP